MSIRRLGLSPRRQVVNSVVGTRSWGYPGNGAAEASAYVQDRATGTGDITQQLGWRPDGRLGTSTYNPGTIDVGGPPSSSNFTGTYGYDPAGQLTSRSVSGTGYATSTTYSYDAMGRRLTEATSTTSGGQTTDNDVYLAWYSDRDQLLSTSSTPTDAEVQYSWDFDGSLTGRSDVSGSGAVHLSEISYDARGLPLEYREGANDTLAATRTYDGDGRLSRVAVAGGSTYDLSWDPTMEVPQVLEVFMGTNTWSRLAYGDERVGYGFMLNGTQAAYGTYGYDFQGSTITTPDAQAPVGYDPFGAPIGPPAGDMFFGYRGELHIGDTIHLRNRDYDPTLGMFTSPDPIDGIPGTPTANAVYPYANNDPTNNTDPLGLSAIGQVSSLLRDTAPVWVTTETLATAGCVIFNVSCLTALGVGLIIAGVVIGTYLIYKHTRPAALPASQAADLPVTNPTAPSTTDVPVGPRTTTDDSDECDPPPGTIDKHGRLKRRSGNCEAHHIIQNRTMFEADGRTKIYPQYTRYSAPAIVLTRESHVLANAIQNTTPLGGTYGDETLVAERSLEAAGMTSFVAPALEAARLYFVVKLRLHFGSRTFPPLLRPSG